MPHGGHLLLLFNHNRALGEEGCGGADGSQHWCKKGPNRTPREWDLEDAFACFVLDRYAADVALVDKLLDPRDQILAIDFKFFCARSVSLHPQGVVLHEEDASAITPPCRWRIRLALRR